MYHCHIHFHLAGVREDVSAVIEGMEPLVCFTHEFARSEGIQEALQNGADVVIADLRDMDVKEAGQRM